MFDMWGSNKPQHQHPHFQRILTPDSVQMAIKCKCFASREKCLIRGMRATCLAPSTNMAEMYQEKKGMHTHPESCSLIRELKVCRFGVTEMLILSLALSSTRITSPSAGRSTSPFQQSFFFLYLREKKYLTSSTNTACHWASNDSAVSSKTWPQTMMNGWSGAPVMRSYGRLLTHCDTFILQAFVIQVAAMMDWILKRGCQYISEKVLIW